MAASSSTSLPSPPGLGAFSTPNMTQSATRIRYNNKDLWDVFTNMGHDARQRPPGFAEDRELDRACVLETADDIVTQWRTTHKMLQEDCAGKHTTTAAAFQNPGLAPQNLPAQGVNSHLNPVPHAAAFAAAMAVLPSPVHAANAAALAVKALAQIRVSVGASQQRSYKPPVCPSGLASTTAPCMMPLAGYSTSSQNPAAANISTPAAGSFGGPSTPTESSTGQDSWSGEQQSSMAPPSLNCVPPATFTAIMQPGNTQWEKAVKRLLGLHDSKYAAAAWFVQAPHITGAMGPISVADMVAWLLQGVAPKHLSRPCHKPLLDTVAADPSQLLVCGVLGSELQQVLMSGDLVFMPLYGLLPALARGAEYSPVEKGLVYSAQQAATAPTNRDNLQPGTPGTASCTSTALHPKDQTMLPSFNMSSAPMHPTMGQQYAAAQVRADDIMTLEAALQEVINRATSSPGERLSLVQEGFIPKLVEVLQEPLQVATGQPHTAAAWALFHLLGRSQAAPQGCPAAQYAMAAAGAVKHLTTVLRAVRKSQGSDGGACSTDPGAASTPQSSSTFSSTQSASSPQHEKAAARLQEAVAAVLAGLATTPSGKQAMLDAGTIPSLVRLLGSRFPNVVDAAVGAVRKLSTPEDYPAYTALFKAGVSTMLVHVVATSTNPACKQNALKILLDLASLALEAPSAPSTPTIDAARVSLAHAQHDEYTASNAIDRLVQRGLPAVLMELLSNNTPPSLQARAMTTLLLLASQKPQEVLPSIHSYDDALKSPHLHHDSRTGVQVLQKLICSSSTIVQEGAMQLLQAMSNAGLVGRGHRRSN